jgi:hypothetical protein
MIHSVSGFTDDALGDELGQNWAWGSGEGLHWVNGNGSGHPWTMSLDCKGNTQRYTRKLLGDSLGVVDGMSLGERRSVLNYIRDPRLGGLLGTALGEEKGDITQAEVGACTWRRAGAKV